MDEILAGLKFSKENIFVILSEGKDGQTDVHHKTQRYSYVHLKQTCHLQGSYNMLNASTKIDNHL